jgi:hypothetical protein
VVNYDPKKQPGYGLAEDYDRLTMHFALTCRRCGSGNVVVGSVPVHDYGGDTGSDGGYVTFGCNACKQNDFILFP